MPPLCQATAQLGRLTSGASRASPIHALGCNPRFLAGIACTFGADQPYRRCRDLPLDGGGLSHHALLVLFPNPLEARLPGLTDLQHCYSPCVWMRRPTLPQMMTPPSSLWQAPPPALPALPP